MQELVRKHQKIRTWEERVGIDLDKILQQAKNLTDKDPNVSLMYAPYDKGPYAVPNLGVNYNIFLNIPLSFDSNLSTEELIHRNLHMLGHELGHHKSGWTELKNHFHYELGMKHDVLNMDAIDYECDSTKEDLMIDCKYSEKSLQYAYGFLSSNTPSTIRDAVKLRHIGIERSGNMFEASTIREADFIQLILRVIRRAIVAEKIKSDWKGASTAGIQPSSVERWVSNMKA
ncbi:MAG: hypothetical protein ABEI13_03150, partial [Candidatus Paceibacteria bacterium]